MAFSRYSRTLYMKYINKYKHRKQNAQGQIKKTKRTSQKVPFTVFRCVCKNYEALLQEEG